MKNALMSAEQRAEEMARLKGEYAAVCAENLKLDMSRGKPGAEQLALSADMLHVLEADDCAAENGFDCRNYGLLDGIPEAKRLFAEILGVLPENVIVGGNASLNLMFDYVARACLFGVGEGKAPWKRGEAKFLCPVPGYDRHFTICETLGIEMINVPMTPDGPDMDLVERLVAQDAAIKGIWCVPKYSNPEGYIYSDDCVRRMAALKPAADDFRIMWDNAYVIHPIEGDPAPQANLLAEAAKVGNEDLPIMFTSTSKITFPGAGISCMAASAANIAWAKKFMAAQTIGHDKLNQLRHVRYFGGLEGILAHMQKHAAILRPKFALVIEALRGLADADICSWTEPKGGYFLSVDTMDGCAKRVYALAKEAGVTLTTVGATFPYGIDPRDRNLRIAPSYPANADLARAAEVLCLCIRIASLEKLS